MSFDKLMESVARKHKMGELKFLDNRYHLTIDGRMEVTSFQANGKFYLHGIICQLPKQSKDQQDLLLRLMQKNLGLAMTQRVSLCMEPDSDTLALTMVRPLQGLDEEGVEDCMSEFANNFEFFLNLANQETLAMPAMPTMIMP